MAAIGLSLTGGKVRCDTAPKATLGKALAPRLRARPPGAPIVILIHGDKFSPTQAAPNRETFSLVPATPCFRNTSRPAGLGGRANGVSDAPCLEFAWPAHDADRGGPVAHRFACVIATIDRLAPGRPADLIARSLGARVALQATRPLNRGGLDLILLLGGADAAICASPATCRWTAPNLPLPRLRWSPPDAGCGAVRPAARA